MANLLNMLLYFGGQIITEDAYLILDFLLSLINERQLDDLVEFVCLREYHEAFRTNREQFGQKVESCGQDHSLLRLIRQFIVD